MAKRWMAIAVLAVACSGKNAQKPGGPRADGGADAGALSLDDHGPPPPDARRDPVSHAAPADQFWTLGDAACPDGGTLTGGPSTREAYCAHPDGLHGPKAAWTEDGALRVIGLYERGKMEGVWTTFHPDGSKASVIHYHLGNQHGPSESWHPGGARHAVGSYVDGRPDGTFTVWAPDGAELGSFTMTDGTGVYVGWHDNGQKAHEQEMKFGQAHGRATSWHPNGQQASEMTFARDLPVGRSTSWDDQGRKIVEGSYARGDMDGDWTYYDPATGEIVRVDRYRDAHQLASIDYQDGAPLHAPLAAQGACATDDGVRDAWERATGTAIDEGGCLERARHFPGVIRIGGFAHDRGCVTMGFLVDCEQTARLDPATILARAGWARAKPPARAKIAMDYVAEIQTAWEGHLTDDPAPPAIVQEADGGVTITAWLAEPAGMQRGRTIHQLEYRFSATGALSAKTLDTRHVD